MIQYVYTDKLIAKEINLSTQFTIFFQPNKIMKQTKKYKHPLFRLSLTCLIIAIVALLLVAVLGGIPQALHYLTLFNTLAVASLLFSFLASIFGLLGLWRCSATSIPTLFITIVSTLFFLWLIFNP